MLFSLRFSVFYEFKAEIQAAGQLGHNKEKAGDSEKTNEFTLAGVGTQGKPESVCATLWDAIWVV